jgi:small subunit ribosomal protein S1
MANISLKDLQPNQELTGRVTRTELYGAFVDVGAEKEGLVHISMLKKGRVNRVEDVVEPGKEVTVWVHRVDINAERLELTMIRPVDLKWKDIKPGMHLKGTVVRLENFGAFIEVGAERPGLVHVSEMSTDYVKSPSNVVSVGDEVEVAVLDVDRKKRQIRLSMKAMDEQEMVEEDAEPEIPQATAMEVALRRALEQSENGESPANDSPAESKRSRETQDDILRRTLQQRLKTGSGKE